MGDKSDGIGLTSVLVGELIVVVAGGALTFTLSRAR